MEDSGIVAKNQTSFSSPHPLPIVVLVHPVEKAAVAKTHVATFLIIRPHNEECDLMRLFLFLNQLNLEIKPPEKVGR